MPEQSLAAALARLQAAHPALDPLAALVLLALDEIAASGGLSSARLSRQLDIEHALIRRACAELEALGWVALAPAAGASPALRVRLLHPLE